MQYECEVFCMEKLILNEKKHGPSIMVLPKLAKLWSKPFAMHLIFVSTSQKGDERGCGNMKRYFLNQCKPGERAIECTVM